MKTLYALLYSCLALVAGPPPGAPFHPEAAPVTQAARERMGRKPPVEKRTLSVDVTGVPADTSGVLALVGVGNKYGFIDKAGHEVVPVQ